ncbi:autophagy-related protein 29 [Colletotrichum spaethianum]|uniref:Autophagy-related protein 29 n=1 Tax=Colletotrichum spaethianum TaxID=700344 RepID=A0AA37NUZ9_9PEZI|nr:autophagy-related protein 29 [Colletotrichum spaethianum]GKT42667.1 autophagy-related protein 29 [Colletotrichum spaethianum]
MTDPTYTVFVRLPILRGEFTDPPPVNWDSTKDDVLWNILSNAAKTEIDWNELFVAPTGLDQAAHFDVTVDFLLQQVAYLTERHTAQLRAQVRKATAAAKGSSAPSPIPGAEPQSHLRTVSALSIRRDSPLPRTDTSTPATPTTSSLRPNISRHGSAGTVTHNLGGGSSTRQSKPATSRPSNETQRRRLSSLPIQTTPRSPEPTSPVADELSSPTSSDDESSPAQSRIIRRPPRFQQRDGPGDLEDEDEDAEPAFLQYKPQSSDTSAQDMGSTLRGDLRNVRRTPKGKEKIHHSETSDSSTSSPALVSHGPSTGERRPAGPLSPRRPAELSGKSPSRKGYSRDGSDGTPSMGSSFSDLDDASVTQSALEEALASKMQDGAIGSRFSISQAFRSRYMPKPGQQ